MIVVSSNATDILEEGVDSVVMDCEVDSNPGASVWWRHGDRIVSREKTLAISPVSRSSAGLYTCHAENALGAGDPASLELRVQCEWQSGMQICIVARRDTERERGREKCVYKGVSTCVRVCVNVCMCKCVCVCI